MKIQNMLILALTSLLLPSVVMAQEVAEINTGDTAWMLTASALVLFMLLPGLSLFYGGLVRSKNVLSILMQCFSIACAMSLLWFPRVWSVLTARLKKLRLILDQPLGRRFGW